MTSPAQNYLVIDRYIAEFIPAQALWHALNSGLIDALLEARQKLAEVAEQVSAELQSASLQLALLAGMVWQNAPQVALGGSPNHFPRL